MVHTEVVLECDRGEGLRGGFHLDAFLGLDGLMEPVGIAAALHDTARLLVDDLHLPVDHDVLVVFLEEGVGLQQLVDRMHTLALDGVVREQRVLLRLTFSVAAGHVANLRKLGSNVRQDEELRILHVARQQVEAFVGKFDAVVLLVDHEIELVGHDVHVTHVVLHVELLGLEHACLDARLAEELDEGFVLGESLERTEEEQGAFLLHLLVVALHLLLGLGEELGAKILLRIDHGLHLRAILVEELLLALGYRAGDDQRRTGIVDKHGVDLVDDGVVMLTLHEVLRADSHVVAQVVEAEFVVRAEGDVREVSLAALVGIGLVLVDTVHRETVKHVERPHPFGVTLGEVVVDGDHMHAFAGEGIEKDGERSDECLTLASGHLGNLALMEHDAAKELHVVVDHVPLDFVATGHPVVLVDGFVAVDTDKVVARSQITVEVGGGDGDLFLLNEAAGSVLDNGEDVGQYFIEHLLVLVGDLLLDLVDLGPDGLALFEFLLVDALAKVSDALFVFGHVVLNVLADLGRLGAQLVVGQLLNSRIGGLHAVDVGGYFFQISLRLIAEQLSEYLIKSHECMMC